MIKIKIPAREFYDDEEGFSTVEEKTLRFEHSLYSIAKWESKYLKPFMDKRIGATKSNIEVLDYYMMMCLDDISIEDLSNEVLSELNTFLKRANTATVITNREMGYSGTIETSEVIYGIMVIHEIPFEAQYWPFDRLMMLIQVITTLKTEPKKMSREETLTQNQQINEQRKKQFNSKG